MLNSIGYDASVKSISGNIQFTYIQNTNNKVQISLSIWYQDYPAASDFLNVLFGCDSFHPGSDDSINISGFCDKAIDAKMKHALATGATDPVAANREWAADRQAGDRPGAAPRCCSRPSASTSCPSECSNFVFNAQYYWLHVASWIQ